MDFRSVIEAVEPFIYSSSGPENDICGIAYDSRAVQPGFAFVAIPGARVDGHDFIPDAIDRGAAVVICEKELDLSDRVGLVLVKDSRRALAALSAAFFDHPDRRLRLIGVTGTNGKTTTANLIKYLLEKAGHKSGFIGTLGSWDGDEQLSELLSASTTPEPLELFRLLDAIVEKDCNHAVIEASSHALVQGRVSSCRFACAFFTNLTQDHLDYH
ncbi:MAG: UDP-N-acetylmuramoyl-L-alanyl-D-glutamate--2,6-diaminopimelate ligase, partial [Firmicutes bacterium]|nr:UDP-N-acetylmuramoyl-L-alanyl-D-glutamate--2,6-diaminopimelate ligase [Bacillota bacterium]